MSRHPRMNNIYFVFSFSLSLCLIVSFSGSLSLSVLSNQSRKTIRNQGTGFLRKVPESLTRKSQINVANTSVVKAASLNESCLRLPQSVFSIKILLQTCG